MRFSRKRALSLTLAVVGSVAVGSTRGDEPNRISRLFRMGSSGAPVKPVNPPVTDRRPAVAAMPPAASLPAPASSDGAAGSRLVPQPRVSRAVTESDPILTRVSIGRSDDGKHFGMCLQVFADGTVIDGEGVHHASADVMRPLVQSIEAADAARLRGHCGGPATDFIEQVHVVVYERAYGKLRATAFSYSGNPQGCDPSVRQLHAAVEALQAKIAGPVPTTTSPTPNAPITAAPVGVPSPTSAPPITLNTP